MKIKGAELAAFMKEGWPKDEDNWFWDHDLFDDKPDDSITYETDELGPIIWQGSDPDPTSGVGLDLARLIRTWRKSRTHDLLQVSIPKEKRDEFLVLLKELGGALC